MYWFSVKFLLQKTIFVKQIHTEQRETGRRGGATKRCKPVTTRQTMRAVPCELLHRRWRWRCRCTCSLAPESAAVCCNILHFRQPLLCTKEATASRTLLHARRFWRYVQTESHRMHAMASMDNANRRSTRGSSPLLSTQHEKQRSGDARTNAWDAYLSRTRRQHLFLSPATDETRPPTRCNSKSTHTGPLRFWLLAGTHTRSCRYGTGLLVLIK